MSITLNWIDNATTEDGFRVQRSTGDELNYAIIGVAGGTDTTSYVDSTVAPNTTYYYQVHAYNGSPTPSAWSNSDFATTDVGPPASLDLSASGRKVRGKKTFDLFWSPADGGSVDVYLDGAEQITTGDDGSFTLGTNLKGGGSHNVYICQSEGGGICSNVVTVNF